MKSRNISCDICAKIFSNRDSLKRHNKKSHIPTHAVKCPYCDKVQTSSDSLKRHTKKYCQKSGQAPLPVSCPKCHKLMNQASLSAHLKHHDDDGEQHVCEICTRVYSSKQSYKRHVYLHHSSGPSIQVNKCQICDKAFFSKQSLKQHQVTHTISRRDTRKTPCHLCGQPVILRTYNDHIRTCSGRKDSRCYFCQKRFGSFHVLEPHLTNFHTKEKPFACDKCPYKTRVYSCLYSHKKIWHNERKLYPCYFCGQGLREKVILKSHLNAKHIKEKAYKCGYCPKRFTASHGLIIHMGNRGWNEDERGLQVGKHPCKITRGTCPHCGIEMFQKLLDRHIRNVHGPPRFTCYFCGYEFTSYQGLNGHLFNFHLKEKPFKCSHCPYRTHITGNLQKHWKSTLHRIK